MGATPLVFAQKTSQIELRDHSQDGIYLASPASHEVQILNHGLYSLELRLRMLERAKRSIDVEYYIFDPESKTGRLLVQALIKKAQQGVRVRILVDALPNKFDPFWAGHLRAANIQLRVFNSSPLVMKRINHRNHRKHIIVDDVELITGGRNIEDAYFDLDKKYNYLDRDVWLKGPIVKGVRETFDKIWNDDWAKEAPFFDSNRVLSRGAGPKGSSHARSRARSYARVAKLLSPQSSDLELRKFVRQFSRLQERQAAKFKTLVEFISDYPTRKNGRFEARPYLWDIKKHEFVSAKTSLQMETPYLILKNEDFSLLNNLQKKGVRVEILTNGPRAADHQMTATVYFDLAQKMTKAGLDVASYIGDAPQWEINLIPEPSRKAIWGTHSKTYIIDQKHTFIGTYNFDPRSKKLNIESTLFFRSQPNLAKSVAQDMNARRKESFYFYEKQSDGSVRQTNSGCKDLSLFDCFMYRIQRPLGKAAIDLL